MTVFDISFLIFVLKSGVVEKYFLKNRIPKTLRINRMKVLFGANIRDEVKFDSFFAVQILFVHQATVII